MAFWEIDVKQKIQQTYIRVRIEITKIYDNSNITAAITIFTGVTIAKNGAAAYSNNCWSTYNSIYIPLNRNQTDFFFLSFFFVRNCKYRESATHARNCYFQKKKIKKNKTHTLARTQQEQNEKRKQFCVCLNTHSLAARATTVLEPPFIYSWIEFK